MKKQVFSFCSLLTILFFSCEQEPPAEKKVYFMDNEFRDFTIFKEGSWWVYEKDTLTTRDSVYVLQSSFSIVAPDSVDYSWQRSLVQYKSSKNNDTATSSGELIQSTSTYYSKQSSSQSPSSEVLDFFSLKPVGYVLEVSSSLKMKYKELKDTVVNGLPYTNVKIFENLSTPSNTKLPRELWYVKNTGVVRKVLFNGDIWNLVKFNAVQQ